MLVSVFTVNGGVISKEVGQSGQSTVGMSGSLEKKSLVPSKNLHSNLIVIDMIYNPILTKLVKDAKKNGLKTIDGSRMFLHQGIEAFELLTNHRPSISVMEKVLMEALR